MIQNPIELHTDFTDFLGLLQRKPHLVCYGCLRFAPEPPVHGKLEGKAQILEFARGNQTKCNETNNVPEIPIRLFSPLVCWVAGL